MIFTDPPSHLNGLPQADSNRELQEKSLRALRNVLPSQDFVLRDERAEDAGVDVSLELLIEGRYTNLRSQVQVKSTGSPRELTGGFVSYPVPVHNVLYLLNSSSSPLYVLYIETRDELRFAWARDEGQRLNETSPGWEEQGSVSLRFGRLLNAQTLSEIRERVEREARLQSQVHEVLGRSAVGEITRVCIEADTLRSTDPVQQEQIILEQGITLVNAGRAGEVVEAAQALNPTSLRKARVQLVLGYAYYLQTQFTMAVAALSQAALSVGDLSDDDRQFLACLRDTCDYYTGRIPFEAFGQRASRWNQEAATGTAFVIGFRLDELRHQLNSVAQGASPREAYRLVETRRQVVEQIRDYVQEVEQNPQVPSILRLQAITFWTHAIGTQTVLEDKLRWSKAMTRLKMEQDPHIEGVLEQSLKSWGQWESLIEGTLQVARRFGHPLPIADLLLNRATISHLRLLNSVLRAIIFRSAVKPNLQSEIAQLQEEVQEAKESYVQMDFLEGQLQCRLVAAQLQVLQGQVDEARGEAEDVLPIAQAMQYPLIEAQAQQIMEGQTVLEKTQHHALANAQEDEDERLAKETDQGLRQFAKQQMENLQLPAERWPILERDVFSMRDAARQRLSWCRHLQLIQDKTHTKSPLTLLASEPFRCARCEKFGWDLAFECTDWNIALSSFQYTICRGCPYRSPKNPLTS